MRNTELGSNTSDTTLSSSLALGRSWPNGFSMITRRHAPSDERDRPEAASCLATCGNARGGTDM